MINQDSNMQRKFLGFRGLLFFLLVYLVGSPFLLPYPSFAILVHTFLSITLFVSVYAVQKQQNYRTFAMAFLLPILIVYWLGIYDIIPFGRHGSYVLLVIYFGLLIHSFAEQIFRSERITLNVIFATLCLYLILGLFWGALYSLHYEISPGSYAGALLEKSDGSNLLTTFSYFSMVTLTTLGYGDITPQTPGAGALCQVEAITGQFYTTVVVAWLVGNFVSDKQRHAEEPK